MPLPPHDPVPPRPAPRRRLFLALGAAVLAIAVLFVVLMLDARRDARLAAEVAGRNLATALAQDIDRNIELLDLALQEARDTWSDPRIRGLEPGLRQRVVFDRSASASYIDAVLVVDRTGAVVADSRSTVPRPDNLRGLDVFAAQVARDAGLAIGRPMRVPGKRGWRIAFSRRITDGEGGFAGITVGILDLTYLHDTYRNLPLGPCGVLTLFNVDGTMLVHEPEIAHAVGQSAMGRAVFDTMLGAPAGSTEGRSLFDGRGRLYAFQRVGTLPLIQAVGFGTDSVYAAWRTKSLALGTALALLCAGMLTLLVVLRRELLQRAAAEAALDRLASTDHLTGLLARRRFFGLAEARWAEAVEQGTPLAVLMIDVDHFKRYNDHYGHLAGDEALVALAGCMRDAIAGRDGLAARFGGEEFIVLLPGCGAATAAAVAEALRAAVAGLALPHALAPAGLVTVSVGAAAMGPGAPSALGALVDAADAALYRAKSEGRNRASGGERLLSRLPCAGEALSA